jgi:hypothetical protein
MQNLRPEGDRRMTMGRRSSAAMRLRGTSPEAWEQLVVAIREYWQDRMEMVNYQKTVSGGEWRKWRGTHDADMDAPKL